MNQGPFIFLGVLLAMAVSWYGMVVGPVLQLGGQQVELIEMTGSRYPSVRPGLAQQGRDVYRANGCNYCHTQQVQARGYKSDFERGWGVRPSVAQDFLLEQPVMLGSQRVGPDLANLGARQTNEVRLLMHLFDPQSVSPGSVMPAFRYLFEKRAMPGGKPSADALPLSPASVEKGFEIVPKREARALVAYLLSLDAQTPLFEAPWPPKPKATGDTNQPPAGVPTNAAAPAAK